MKFIFDFDNVLFKTRTHFKEHLIGVLERAGISRDKVEEYWKKGHLDTFSLKKMLTELDLNQDLYEEIMNQSKNFVNEALIKVVENLGEKNSFVVTFGDKEFQLDKIQKAGIAPLFSEIIVVQGSKKEAIEKICVKYKDEKVIFVDDRANHFEDLDFVKYPNLKTILYDEQGLDKLKTEIKGFF